MVRSSEVRRVASRLAAQLALALPPPPAKFAGPCTGTGWKVDKKGKFRGKLVIATEAGMFVATGFLAWDDRKAEVELTGPATAKPVLRGKMTVTKDPATWHLRVELERTDTELRGRFIEVYQGDDHEDEDEHATEKEMCTFTWPAV